MERDELALIWLNQNGFSFSKSEKILKEFDKIEYIFEPNLVKNAVFDFAGGGEVKEKLLQINEESFRKKVEDELYNYDIKVITYASKGYPEKLKNIDEPPLVLYYRGDVELLNKKSIAIVGTRKPSDYGKLVCEKFTKALSNAGLVTVSGLAYGTDTIVAETTLFEGGKTIAVLGGGLDSIYPYQNKALSERIEKSGLLLSEYMPKMKPTNYSFLERNRIVSALSLGTVIIEAGKRSGTMTTARCAIEQGRELFVIPGNINSPQSEGTNNLIDELPDTFTITPDRILSRLGIEKRTEPKSKVQVNLDDNLVLTELENGEKTFDELCDTTKIEPSKLSPLLVKMEMFGLIKKGNSNTYYKI